MKNETIQDAWRVRKGFHAEAAMKHETIQGAWKIRNEFHAEGDAECSRLRAVGDRFYQNTVLGKYGPDAIIDWETGEIETK
jgi:hypothetical protein